MSAARGDDLERRTIRWLEQLGYRAERVSRRSRFRGGDLFGVIDIVAVRADGPLFAQVTTKSHASEHRRKIRDAGLGWPVQLFLWFKNGGRWVFVSEEVAPNPVDVSDGCAINIASPGGASTPAEALTETALKGRA